MTGTDFRHLFTDEDWRCLQSSVVLVCRDAAAGWSDAQGWEAIGRALAGLATAYSRSKVEGDLAQSVVATLAEPDVRGRRIADVRSAIARGSESELFALTERAGRLVDQFCPDQGYSFRVTLTLISMLIADHGTGGRAGRRPGSRLPFH